jgi:hypothetical protein
VLHERHVNAIHIGPLFAIDFDVDEVSFMICAISPSLEASRSMTWHQWQVE